MVTEMNARKYTPTRRAEQQEQTRARIVRAAMALHEELGPRDTTISAVAARAGVQRLTVYRHFPDDGSLFTACSSLWLELNPPPDSAQWQDLAEPAARCRAAFAALHGYYRRTERMWNRAYRDEEEVPALKAVMGGFEAYLDAVRDDLLATWPSAPSTRRLLKATLGHCLRFSTWRSLDREGLSDAEMANVIERWLVAL
jgi:AcrR family transcriptional regulator